jgi:hypothetical protein
VIFALSAADARLSHRALKAKRQSYKKWGRLSACHRQAVFVCRFSTMSTPEAPHGRRRQPRRLAH